MREKVELAVDVAPNLPTIVADGELISQALLNLLQNADKYGGESKRDPARVRARERTGRAFGAR